MLPPSRSANTWRDEHSRWRQVFLEAVRITANLTPLPGRKQPYSAPLLLIGGCRKTDQAWRFESRRSVASRHSLIPERTRGHRLRLRAIALTLRGPRLHWEQLSATPQENSYPAA